MDENAVAGDVMAEDMVAEDMVVGDVLVGCLPFLLSARSGDALCAQAERLRLFLETSPEVGLVDVAYSLVSHRAHLEHRAAVVAGDRDGLVGCLRALESGGSVDGLVRGVVGRGGRTAFLFSGQGSQWVGMGRELYECFGVFAECLDEVCVELDRYLDVPLRDVLFAVGSGEAGLLDRTRFTQPAIFALEVALFRLIVSFGIEPDYLIGHSIGEISAAHVAGVLGVQDACVLVAARGRLMGQLSCVGAMVAVQASEGEVRDSVAGFGDRLAVAAVNGPEAVVISGDEQALGEWEASFGERGRRLKRLRVSNAFHSGLMDPMLEEFRAIAEGLSFADPEIPIISNVSGEPIASEQARSPAYWVSHARQTVRFYDGVRFLEERGVTRFLELGPGGTLSAIVGESMSEQAESETLITSCLRPHTTGTKTLMSFLCEAYVRGVGVDWGVLFSRGVGGRVELPTYAFQRKRYWLRSGGGLGDAGSLGLSSIEHPLLSTALHLASGGEGWLFTGRLSLQDLSWLGDHVVLDVVVLPGVVFVELALAAAQSIGLGGIEEITLLAPLVLEERGAVQLQLTVSEPDTDGRCELAIYSRVQSSVDDLTDGEQQWTQHATGMLDTADQRVPVELELFAERSWPPEDAEELQTGSFYDRLLEAGYDYGPAFQGLKAAWRHADNIYSEVVLQEDQLPEANSYCIHPALVDAALHIGLSAVLDELGNGEAQIPFTFSGVRLYARGASSLHVHLNNLNNTNRGSSGGHGGGVPSDGDGGVPSVLAVDANGVPVFSIDTVRARPVERGALEAARRGSAQQELYELQWTKLSTASPSNGSALRVAILEPERQQDEHEDGERQHDERKGHEGHEGPERRERQQDEHEDQEREWDGREGWEWVFGELSGLSVERYVGLGGLEGALERGVGLPGYVVVRVGGLVGGVGGGLVGEALLVGVHAVSECVLGLLNAWLAGECFVGARLVFVTEGALVARDGEVPDLVQAPLVGLLRSAHSEHPERFSLIDIDSSQASRDQLYSALVSHESELAIRDGSLYAPRLTRVRVDEGVRVAGLGLEGTVLVSGGTGGLGAVLARHLVVVHGVRRLLLMSRSGLEARGAGDLLEELVGLGCQVDVVACDVTDRAALERVIARVPVEHPISAVVHTAGVIDDGVISSLDSERLRGVMAPKVDGALNLHELTQHLALSEFILFSSSAATLGSPGQGNYAAANAFLDALAYHRRALGLPGLSLALGAWDRATGMTLGLSEADRARWGRLGVLPLSDQQGLELIDVARVVDRGLLLPVRLDSAVLRTQARMGLLPAALSSLVRAPVRRSQDSAGSLARRLAGSPEGDWDAIVLELTLNHVAAVLGHAAVSTVDPQRAFKELGFDSLSAIELRNRLNQATGLALPATLVFDYPTPTAVARYLRSRVEGQRKRASLLRGAGPPRS